MLLWAFSHSFVSCTSLDSWIVLFSMGMRGLVIFVPFLILFYPLKTIESDFNLTFIALPLTLSFPPIPGPFLLPHTHTHSFAWYAMKFIVSNECATNISGPYTAQKNDPVRTENTLPVLLIERGSSLPCISLQSIYLQIDSPALLIQWHNFSTKLVWPIVVICQLLLSTPPLPIPRESSQPQ